MVSLTMPQDGLVRNRRSLNQVLVRFAGQLLAGSRTEWRSVRNYAAESATGN